MYKKKKNFCTQDKKSLTNCTKTFSFYKLSNNIFRFFLSYLDSIKISYQILKMYKTWMVKNKR